MLYSWSGNIICKEIDDGDRHAASYMFIENLEFKLLLLPDGLSKYFFKIIDARYKTLLINRHIKHSPPKKKSELQNNIV